MHKITRHIPDPIFVIVTIRDFSLFLQWIVSRLQKSSLIAFAVGDMEKHGKSDVERKVALMG